MNPKNVVLAWERNTMPDKVRILGNAYEVCLEELPDGEDGYILPCKQ